MPNEMTLPFSTIAKILLVLLVVAGLRVLSPLLIILYLASIIAVSLHPVVIWFENKGLRKKWCIGMITLLLVLFAILIGETIIPALFKEFSNFLGNLPKLKEQILSFLEESSPLRSIIERSINRQMAVPVSADIAPIFSAGNIALTGFAEIVLIFVFSIYLLIDGKSVIDWLTAFFSASNQEKIRATAREVSPIIFSYVTGQMITSAISFLYVLITLSLLHVPSSLLLATLAGLFDVLPVLGFFLAVVPAVLFALSVSTTTAFTVVILYLIYHFIENYLIVPAVYGNRLRVSSFVVLLTLIAAGLLAGIEGAIAALPIVASYPIVERIWLKKIVGTATVDDHSEAQET